MKKIPIIVTVITFIVGVLFGIFSMAVYENREKTNTEKNDIDNTITFYSIRNKGIIYDISDNGIFTSSDLHGDVVCLTEEKTKSIVSTIKNCIGDRYNDKFSKDGIILNVEDTDNCVVINEYSEKALLSNYLTISQSFYNITDRQRLTFNGDNRYLIKDSEKEELFNALQQIVVDFKKGVNNNENN